MNIEKLFDLADPYLAQGLNKDFKLHTLGVVRAVQELLDSSIPGEADIVIPAAIFHDTGWANVPEDMQGEATGKLRDKGMRRHLVEGAKIAKEVLSQNGYSDLEATEIARIISQHKLSDPNDINARIIIDADNLSDIYKEQFASDMVFYKNTPAKLLSYRMDNSFYFPEAKEIFEREVKFRKIQYGIK